MTRSLATNRPAMRIRAPVKFGALLFPVMVLSLSALKSYATEGKTPGTFAVSPTGAATYSIPIYAPPGPRGLQPTISLDYNSQSGIGPLGSGWSIGGLSQISLCNRTIAQDSVASQVIIGPPILVPHLGNKVCVDGKRLRVTVPGYPSSTYQSEIADFANFNFIWTAQATTYFSVQARNGFTYLYGYTDANGNGANSTVRWPGVLGTGGTTGQWLLSKVIDRAGNNYVINYTSLQGTVVPSSIKWTSTGAATYAYTMTFNYPTPNTAQSSIYAYSAGTPVINTDLLTSITISYSTNVVKNYVLNYEVSPTTGHKRLNSVTECADAAATNCLIPTKITYQNGLAGVSTSSSPAVTTASQKPLGHYDLNGDGYPDLVYVSGGMVYVSFWIPFGSSGYPSTYGPPVNTGISAANFIAVSDILGNGVDGIVANNGGTLFYYTYNGAYSLTGTGFSGVTTTLKYSGPNTLFLDVNGDGLPDMITWTAPTSGATAGLHINSQLNTSVGSGSGGTVGFNTIVNDMYDYLCYQSCTVALWHPDNAGPGPLRSWDFKNDNTSDLLYVSSVPNPNGYPLVALFSHSDQTTYKTTFQANIVGLGTNATLAFQPPFVADWNGDGCADVIWNNTVQFSACDGNFGSPQAIAGTPVAVIDWDGDGRDDLLVANGSNFGVYLSTGSGVAGLAPTSVPYSTNCSYFTTDIDNDGLGDLGCWNRTTSPYPVSYYLHNAAGVLPDLATTISDGYGNSVSPIYESNGLDCSVVGWATAGYKATCAPLQVVSQATFTDPSSPTGTYLQDFIYGEAEVNLQGRGFSGFGLFYQYDSRSQTEALNFNSVIFPTVGMGSTLVQDLSNVGYRFIFDWERTPKIVTLDSTVNNQRYFSYYSNVTESETDPSVTYLPPKTTTSTTTAYDNYGNVLTQVKTITDGDAASPYLGYSWTTSVTNSPDILVNTTADLAAWCLPLLDQTQTVYSSTFPGSTSVTRTQTFTPDTPANCRITTKVTEPTSNGGLYKVTDAFTFDSFGNVFTDTVTGANMPSSPASRKITNNWGTTGQFLTQQTDPSGALTIWSYTSLQSLTFGVPDSKTDANNLKVSWIYDAFGRRNNELRPDGTSTTWTITPCTSHCGWSNSVYQVAQAVLPTVGTTPVRIDTSLYDPLDRITQTSGPTVTGASAVVQTLYNSLGLVAKKSMPFIAGATAYQQTNLYDVLNRLTSTTRPISATASGTQTTVYTYSGRTTTITDPKGQITSNITDVNGWLRQVKDPAAYTVTRAYDSAGSLIGIIDSAGNPLLKNVTYQYGIKPFLTSMIDMDLGSWSYTLDSLGERIGWKDAKNQSFSMSYDALSRPTLRTEPDLTTNWTWGSTPSLFNVGQLVSISAVGSNGTHIESNTYDNRSRLSTKAFTIPSDPYPNPYIYTYSYNATTGLLDTMQYPVSPTAPQLKLQYAYANGIMQSIADFNTPATVYWKANAENARGQVTQETLGNGVVTNRSIDAVTGWTGTIQSGLLGGAALQNFNAVYDALGNVTQRQDSNRGLTENFYYDADNRLEHSTLNGTQNLKIVYDAANMGNIASRTDVNGGAAWTYDPVRKHAVITAGSAGYLFAYDANGNTTTRYAVAGNTWTSFNQPSFITNGSQSLTYFYDGNHQRYKQIYSSGPGDITYSIGKEVEKVYNQSGIYDYRHYIFAYGRRVALVSRLATGVNTTYYFLGDHISSTTSILNSNGTDYVDANFSAYGAGRDPANWSGAIGSRGPFYATTLDLFTGQQTHLLMNLVNLNGRMLDAVTGRMMSADPTIPESGNTQSYNRYSYVNNNPLSFTDPSGFSGCGPKLRNSWCAGIDWSGVSAYLSSFLEFTGSSFAGGGGQPSGGADNPIAAFDQWAFGWQDPTVASAALTNTTNFSSLAQGGLSAQGQLDAITVTARNYYVMPASWPPGVSSWTSIGNIAHVALNLALLHRNPALAGRLLTNVAVEGGFLDLALDGSLAYELKPESWQYGSNYDNALDQIGGYTSGTGYTPGTWAALGTNSRWVGVSGTFSIYGISYTGGFGFYYDQADSNSGIIFYQRFGGYNYDTSAPNGISNLTYAP